MGVEGSLGLIQTKYNLLVVVSCLFDSLIGSHEENIQRFDFTVFLECDHTQGKW